MYTITCDGRPLFDPSVPGYALESPKLELEANRFGTLTFTIYPDNPEYSNIVIKKSRIKVYRDGVLIFEARPALYNHTLTGGVEYTCEDALSRLNDILWRPETFETTIINPLQELVLRYRIGQGSEETGLIEPDWLNFYIGTVYGYHLNPIDVDKGGNAYEKLWDAIADPYIEENGGYFVPTYSENNGITLDYYGGDEYLPQHPQAIELGKNLADISIEIDAEDFFTSLIPQGADEKIDDPDPDEIKKMPLTIADVNDGKVYLDSSGVATYGRIERTVRWDWIKNATDLKGKGQTYLDKYGNKFVKSISLSALDLHDAGFNVDALEWMTQVRVVAPTHNIDDYYTVRRMEIMLGDPSATQIEIGNERPAITNRVTGNAGAAKNMINALDDRIFRLENLP